MARPGQNARNLQPPPPETTPPEDTEQEKAPPAPPKAQVRALLWNPARNLSIQVTRADLMQLKPGWNFVPEKLWKDASKNEQVIRLIETLIPKARAPEEMSAKVGQPHLVVGKVMDKDNPLRTLDLKEALQFVQETFVIATLRRLLEQEQRAEILRAIRGQIDSIEKPKDAARREKQARDDDS